MSSIEYTIAFIGAGNMAGSIIRGLMLEGFHADSLMASAPSKNHLAPLEEKFGIRTSTSNTEVTKHADIVVLGVKPQIMQQVCEEIAETLTPNAFIISLAAGVTCNNIETWLGGDRAVVRCMSNTPAQVMVGASGLYANPLVNVKQKQMAEQVLGAVGIARWVDSEELIDTVTALVGSGPAYFFLFMEAMIDSACKQGMDRDTASELAMQTALGAAKLAQMSEDDLPKLRARVTSPKGTTERAIASFEENNLRGLVEDAMSACANRARELSGK